jgi:hypothetical protein
VHGTTFEVPAVRFERDERARLRPLPSRALVVRERRLHRKTPCPISQLTAEPAAAVPGPLAARDRQRLADERMPAVMDGDGSRKLRSM